MQNKQKIVHMYVHMCCMREHLSTWDEVSLSSFFFIFITSCQFSEFADRQVNIFKLFVYAANFCLFFFPAFLFFFFLGGVLFKEMLYISEGFHSLHTHPDMWCPTFPSCTVCNNLCQVHTTRLSKKKPKYTCEAPLVVGTRALHLLLCI